MDVSRTPISGNYRKELAVIVSIPVQQKVYITTHFMKFFLGNTWKLSLQCEGKSSLLFGGFHEKKMDLPLTISKTSLNNITLLFVYSKALV